MGRYRMGDPRLDEAIEELVAAAGDGDDQDLIAELVTTALKLQRDGADRWELKLFNSALKEMRYSSKVFRAYEETPKVTIFGSARTRPDHPDYRLACEFARHMWEDRGWMVVTGAGRGIMEAGNRGGRPSGLVRCEHPAALRGRGQPVHRRVAADQLQVLLHPQAGVRKGVPRLRHLPGGLRHHG